MVSLLSILVLMDFADIGKMVDTDEVTDTRDVIYTRDKADCGVTNSYKTRHTIGIFVDDMRMARTVSSK